MLTDEQLAEITWPAATDELIQQFVQNVQDRQKHVHPAKGQGEDFYCMNLACYMGERMGAVLARLRDAEQRAKAAEQRLDYLAGLAREADHETSEAYTLHDSVTDLINACKGTPEGGEGQC